MDRPVALPDPAEVGPHPNGGSGQDAASVSSDARMRTAPTQIAEAPVTAARRFPHRGARPRGAGAVWGKADRFTATRKHEAGL